jgi:hypothetical protein
VALITRFVAALHSFVMYQLPGRRMHYFAFALLLQRINSARQPLFSGFRAHVVDAILAGTALSPHGSRHGLPAAPPRSRERHSDRHPIPLKSAQPQTGQPDQGSNPPTPRQEARLLQFRK